MRIGLDPAGVDLVLGGAGEAETAGREVGLADPHGRAEGAAGEGPVRVEIAAAGLRIESGAGEGGVPGEVRIGVLAVVQESGLRIAGEAFEQEGELPSRTLDDGGRALRIEKGEAGPEAAGVQGVDRERAVAALGAPGTAGETLPGQGRGLGHGLLDDVEKPPVLPLQILRQAHGPDDSIRPMAFDPLPHLWTLGPRLRHAVRPRPNPGSVPWETVVEDPKIGPVRLTGRLRELPGDELLILVHGLGGSTDSHYMLRGAEAAEAAGLSCLRLHLRGADRRGEDFYHAGLTADLHAALASPEAARFRRIHLLGYSLGGHVALRLATEPADPRLVSVAAVCSPVDLARSADEIDAPGLGLYRWYLLRSLADIYRQVAARRPVSYPVEKAGEIRFIREWDDKIVAPRHGFAGASDYYARRALLRSCRI